MTITTGKRVGCVLIHGFGGETVELRSVAQYLLKLGVNVSLISPRGFSGAAGCETSNGWEDWVEETIAACRRWEASCDSLFLIGHSAGATLALLASEEVSAAGVIAYSPISHLQPWKVRLAYSISKYVRCVPVTLHINPWLYRPGFKLMTIESINELNRMFKAAPNQFMALNGSVLLISGGMDIVVPPNSSTAIAAKLVNAHVYQVNLPFAGHLPMLGVYRRRVKDETIKFIKAQAH